MNPPIKPRHIAIIMDGNGRWARKRFLPRVAGHKAGVDAVRKVVKSCVENKIEVLTLFAFSSENWRRPKQEISYLMDLFISALEREANKLHEQNIQLNIIGDRSAFDEKLQKQMRMVEELTHKNSGLKLVIAANYGGQWDLCQATKQIAADVSAGKLLATEITPELMQSYLSLPTFPQPDLFIRTSGEQRISNFYLWQLAYTELYFSSLLWPDFDEEELTNALNFFAERERRFGCTSDQLKEDVHA